MKTDIDLKKIVWAFMLENGELTTGDWNYYTGYEYSDPKKQYCYSAIQEGRDNMINSIKKYGVNWDKTGIPEYEEHSYFVGTFQDSEECRCFVGTLYLNDGSEYKLGTREVSKAAMYAYNHLQGEKPLETDLVEKYFGD